ncbi:filament-like plant protein 7 [Cucurbita maxima]|uniref:Filament-like plant protein 7 n=1 Tax=Cucurbita maxima TaxID=3661 RepID=A0A6J1L6M1_CUCMA|nr:filament-like plant protein 7 [Cucurbita maxima]XP_023007043.1 filament-like plant protein 7 [Cucurbita maxima]
MDQKSWLWRKKSSEKIIVSSDKVNLSVNKNEEETLLIDKARLEKDLEIANDKLSVALSDCKTKDELVKKLTNMEQEAIARWEKAKYEVAILKQDLNDAVQKRLAGEERLIHLDAALKECMQQLRFVREEQEQRIHDAVSKTSNEFEKTRKILEEKLADTCKRLSKLGGENTQLSKALLVKDKMIEDLNRELIGVETDLNALVSRLESTEKEKGSLKYEVRVLEKEVEIRNEEREFHRRTADASHKQHLEGVKKIAKLESECQRLRLLVRKRLPGPAALVKMKNEVEMLGRDSFEIRRRQSNPTSSLDSSLEISPETPNEHLNVATCRVSALEEENCALKEALNKKNNELQVIKIMQAQASSLQIASPHELSNGQKVMESGKSGLTLSELPVALMSDAGSDDKGSSAELWASPLISEFEHFNNGKLKGSPTTCKIVGSSDLELMDDFVEMEKLAIVSVEKSAANSHFLSNEVNGKPKSVETELKRCYPEAMSKSSNPGSCLSYPDVISGDISTSKVPDWLQNISKMVLDQSSFSKRDPEQMLEDIRAAMIHRSPEKLIDTELFANRCDEPNVPCNNGSMLPKPSGIDSVSDANEVDITHQVDIRGSVSRLIELVEGISVSSLDDDKSSYKKDGSFYSETPTGYMVRVFQWKMSELNTTLKQFMHNCYDLLNGKASIENFLQDLNSTLDWIMNHCFSLQDVSSMRESIKKHFDWDESRSDCDLETGTMVHVSEVDKSRVSTGELQSTLTEEHRKLKEELTSVESAKNDLEAKFQSTNGARETRTNQLQESEKKIVSLEKELETLRVLKGTIEGQIADQQVVNHDLDAQLTAAKNELNETRRKFTALEVELDNKNNFFEELEATCLELQLQLESTRKQNPSMDLVQEEKQLRTEWEITTASERLAECQETILNLGKQLKALATPKEAALLDKVILNPNDETQTLSVSTTTTTPTPMTDTASTPTVSNIKTTNNRFSLLDQMLAEDDAFPKDHEMPKPVEVDANHTSTSDPDKAIDPQKAVLIWNGHKNGVDKDTVGNLAIVPSRKQGDGDGGLWRKLLWRKKKGRSHKKAFL